MWVAGGSFKPGITYGQTDELGFNVTENPIHVRDLHATILHLLGFDHTKLTLRFQGGNFRLTDVHGKIISRLLAQFLERSSRKRLMSEQDSCGRLILTTQQLHRRGHERSGDQFRIDRADA
jgi:hypothetical protein